MNKALISFGYVALIFTIVKSLWDIDIVIGSLTTRGTVVNLAGIPAYDFYHMALIRLLLAVFIICAISLYLILRSEGIDNEDKSEE